MRRLVDALLFQIVQPVEKFRARVGKFNAALGASELGRLAGCLHQCAIQGLATLAKTFKLLDAFDG